MKENNKLMIIALGFLLLGFLIGYGMGIKTGISWCVDKGISFLKVRNISLGIDTEQIKQGIFQYKNQIDNCFPS